MSARTVRGCVQLVQVLPAFLSAPHFATPTNFFLGLAFSGALSSRQALQGVRLCAACAGAASVYPAQVQGHVLH